MKLNLTGRHFEITPHLRKHLDEKMLKLEKFNDQIIEGEVVLFKDHVSDIAEGKIHIGHVVIAARGEADDMYAAVNDLTEKILVQLQRHEGRLRSRKRLSHPRGD